MEVEKIIAIDKNEAIYLDSILTIDKGKAIPSFGKTAVSENVINQISKAVLFTDLYETEIFDLHLSKYDLNILREAVSWGVEIRDENGISIDKPGKRLKIKIHQELVGEDAMVEYINFRNIIKASNTSDGIDITDIIWDGIESDTEEETN